MTDEQRYRMLVSEKWSDMVYRIPMEIEKLKDANSTLEEMKDGICSPAYNDDMVNSSGATSGDERVFRLAFNSMEAIERNNNRINELMQERSAYLLSCIELESPLCELLSHRYIRRETWEDVAENIGYSQQHCREYLKSRALIALYDFIPLEYMGKVNTP